MSVSFQRKAEDNQPSHTTFIPFPTSPRVPDNDIIALVTDFFHWVETDWQLPVFTKELQRPYLPPQVALTKEFYTVERALREALIFAAKINPNGLFQQETYSPTCHRKRKQGQHFASLLPKMESPYVLAAVHLSLGDVDRCVITFSRRILNAMASLEMVRHFVRNAIHLSQISNPSPLTFFGTIA